MESMHTRLKTHRRTLTLGGSRYTILSPRPSVEARFATNHFHETWQIVTDTSGAQLLARLCWAMAFQRHPRALIVIDPSLLVPNPYDGDPPLPIVIVNNDLSPLDREATESLEGALPFRTPSEGTVVLQTRGLDIALNDPQEFEPSADRADRRDARTTSQWIDETAGLLVIAAPPAVLRSWGVEISGLSSSSDRGSSQSDLGHSQKEGGVQVLEQLSSRVARAVEVRNQLFPGRSKERLPEGDGRQVRQLLDSEECH
jgi:hypothetical protein